MTDIKSVFYFGLYAAQNRCEDCSKQFIKRFLISVIDAPFEDVRIVIDLAIKPMKYSWTHAIYACEDCNPFGNNGTVRLCGRASKRARGL